MKRRSVGADQKIRVLVVDDSSVSRMIITRALSRESRFELAGTAPNGRVALDQLSQTAPHVILLDLEMPVLNGLETLKAMRAARLDTPVIILSAHAERGSLAVLDALSCGALDYVLKGHSEWQNGTSGDLSAVLSTKILALFTAAPSLPNLPPAVLEQRQVTCRDVVCIGVSTGGPAALAEMLPKLPKDFPLPVLVVQHMPPIFTRGLAERLNQSCALQVHEAYEGCAVEPGTIWIAPGDFHMQLRQTGRGVKVALDQGPPESSCRPAVDVLFRSVAEVYGGNSIAVILTGMGYDGLKGCEVLRKKGARILVQDQPSSVVWGMPGAVARAGLADQILTLRDVAPEIVKEAECILQP